MKSMLRAFLKTLGTEHLESQNIAISPGKKLLKLTENKKNIVILCIGADRIVGDSLGPLVGTFLEETNCPCPIYGTLSTPIHATNIDKMIEKIKASHPCACIIAIDACIGGKTGDIIVSNAPIHPGKGLGKQIQPVGDISIVGCVTDNYVSYRGFSEEIHLGSIYKMARDISKMVSLALNVHITCN